MKLGIMQPYFFPYAQQVRHIAQCDQWVVFDTPQFTRKSWITRNRIADRNTEWTYISVPVEKGASRGSIAEARIWGEDWKATLRDRLRVYEHHAPFYAETVALVDACIESPATTVADLNTTILRTVTTAFAITTPIVRLTELDLDLPSSAAPGEWALLISEQLGASVYSNAPGGRHLFDADLYRSRGVELEFYEPVPLEFATSGLPFTPDLSLVDPLMWLGVDGLASWCAAG